MFTRYQIANVSSTVPTALSSGSFEGTVNPGIGRDGGGLFGDAHGEVEAAHPLTGENGHNPSLSSVNHALNVRVVLDSHQQKKSEVLFPRGKVAWFFGAHDAKPTRWKTMGFSARQSMAATHIVFGNTKLSDGPDVTEFTWCLPAASATFVPGRANPKSTYITFAVGDSAEIFLDPLEPTHFQHETNAMCKSGCLNPNAATTRSFEAGVPIFCAPKKSATDVLATMVCAHHRPKNSIYLGVLKVPWNIGDQSITVALSLSH